MAAPVQTTPDTLISVKIAINNNNRRFKLPLRDLGATTFPARIRYLLAVQPAQKLVLERFSDSAGAFITLDSNNPAIYKQLYRAAKAKLKLRIKATIIEPVSADFDAETAKKDVDVTLAREAPKPTVSNNPMSLESIVTSTPAEELFSAATKNSATRSTICGMASPLSTAAREALVPRPFSFVSFDQPKAETVSTCTDSAAITNLHPSCTRTLRCSYTVYCNNCDRIIPDAHYHCNTCENGDFDLCQTCVDGGVSCGGQDHWLIKRFLQNGNVIRSTTMSIAPKKDTAFKQEVKQAESPVECKVEEASVQQPTRTCNACVSSYPEDRFITCKDCFDYDLCMSCHADAKHGHHPGHAFEPASKDITLSARQNQLCKPGRDLRHFAICDGCDKTIRGVRNKCLDCPDWDFCNDCILGAGHIHPGHRFVPLYDPIPAPAKARIVRHHGIFCDGPMCKKSKCQTYIVGDRYKCAVCHDTDFCSNCEAAPVNCHNKTHPLIKFKTPVRDVSVSTEGQHNGQAMPAMGDIVSMTTRSTGTTTNSPPSVNAATQVQTVADFQPVEAAAPKSESSASKRNSVETSPAIELDCIFVADAVRDGTCFAADKTFNQTWTLFNPGPHAWPIGSSVKFIGGDSMLDVDRVHPSSVSALDKAAESNATTYEVPSGCKYNFSVSLRAPSRSGKNISYWRLTSPTGQKFGHKFWCDINVVPHIEPSLAPSYNTNALADYQMQLILLEQQNKKRIQMAREEAMKREAEFKMAALAHSKPETFVNKLNAELAQNEAKETAPCGAAKIQHTTYPVPKTAEEWNRELAKASSTSYKMYPCTMPNAPAVASKDSSSESETLAKSSNSSEVIFPKLDKESPMSSQHEASSSASRAPSAATATAVPSSPAANIKDEVLSESDTDVDLVEDVESMGLADEDDTEDGFLTDEEYDILDASDEEFLESQSKLVQKKK